MPSWCALPTLAAAVGVAFDLQVGGAGTCIHDPDCVIARPVGAPVSADVEDDVGCGGAVTDAACPELHGAGRRSDVNASILLYTMTYASAADPWSA